ncbi:PP2C family protein-serine/threonine phosphatase [Streptomyces indonesiensis]
MKVEIASGGHLSPLVLRGDGKVEEIVCEGMLVGAVPDPSFGCREFRLAPGELVLLYSDGLTEARGGMSGREIYGDERLVDALAAASACRQRRSPSGWSSSRPNGSPVARTTTSPS